MRRRQLVIWIAGMIILSGCSHQMEVKNLYHYQAHSVVSVPKQLAIGVATTNELQNGQVLVTGTANALTRYAGKVVYPYQPLNIQPVDVVSTINVRPDHKGSGWNFLINFPGFLIFTPAWHGYVYRPSYDVDVELVWMSNPQVKESFTIPIILDVRHAGINRTWTEISWFEVGIIAFIGGIAFTQYDDGVTQPLEQEIRTTIGEYIAHEIMKKLVGSPGIQEVSRQDI